jgi:hypothetical protein
MWWYVIVGGDGVRAFRIDGTAREVPLAVSR